MDSHKYKHINDRFPAVSRVASAPKETTEDCWSSILTGWIIADAQSTLSEQIWKNWKNFYLVKTQKSNKKYYKI